jgi:hypothetical protein
MVQIRPRLPCICPIGRLLNVQLAGAAFGAGYAYYKVMPEIRSIEERQKQKTAR